MATTVATGIRRLRMHGSPSIWAGSTVILAKVFTLAILPDCEETSKEGATHVAKRSHHAVLFLCRPVMLFPVGAIASAMLRDLGENDFGRKPALGEMSRDPLSRLFRRHFGIEKHQH